MGLDELAGDGAALKDGNSKLQKQVQDLQQQLQDTEVSSGGGRGRGMRGARGHGVMGSWEMEEPSLKCLLERHLDTP